MLLTHSLDSFEIIEKLTTWTIVKDKTHKIVSLKTMVQLYNEWVIEHCVNLFFILNDVFLLILRNEFL